MRVRTDTGWILLWALLLFTLVPLRVADHLAARLGCVRRRRAIEAASVLVRVAAGAGQYSDIKAQDNCWARNRIGGSDALAFERRIFGGSGANRNPDLEFLC